MAVLGQIFKIYSSSTQNLRTEVIPAVLGEQESRIPEGMDYPAAWQEQLCLFRINLSSSEII